MKLCWARDQFTTVGNAFGYTRANRGLHYELEQMGALDPNALVAVHFVNARTYRPIPGRVNVLFTMYEAPQLPPYFVEAFAASDAVVVPCTYCANLFRPHTDRPIYVVPLGYDPLIFQRIRRVPHRNHQWLYVGAPNVRKGIDHLLQAWQESGLAARHDALLYVKTTRLDGGPEDREQRGNVYLDRRILTDAQLLEVYASADYFAFPTMGEGFGLTLLEAMATGLPAVAPLHTGIVDFADQTCIRSHRFVPTEFTLADELDGVVDGPQWTDTLLAPDVDDLARQMRWLMADRLRAQRIGARAARKALEFTWRAAAEKLVRVVAAVAQRVAA